MSLVLTDEILWDVDASAREARDAVQLEPSGGPLEGRGRCRKGQEAKKNEAMERWGARRTDNVAKSQPTSVATGTASCQAA